MQRQAQAIMQLQGAFVIASHCYTVLLISAAARALASRTHSLHGCRPLLNHPSSHSPNPPMRITVSISSSERAFSNKALERHQPVASTTLDLSPEQLSALNCASFNAKAKGHRRGLDQQKTKTSKQWWRSCRPAATPTSWQRWLGRVSSIIIGVFAALSYVRIHAANGQLQYICLCTGCHWSSAYGFKGQGAERCRTAHRHGHQ